MAPNVERLARVALNLVLSPDEHEQKTWYNVARIGTTEEVKSMCGTTGCVAGNTQMMFGDKRTVFLPNSDGLVYVPDVFGDYVFDKEEGTVRLYDYYRDRNSSRTLYSRGQIKRLAKELLGLADDQADWLFQGYRSKDEILKGIQYIIDNPTASRYQLALLCSENGY